MCVSARWEMAGIKQSTHTQSRLTFRNENGLLYLNCITHTHTAAASVAVVLVAKIDRHTKTTFAWKERL